MTKIDIHSHMFLRNLMRVMAGKKYRLYTFRDYLELQHIDNGYSVTIREDSWKGVNLFTENKGTDVYFKGNYINETRLLNAVEELLNVVDGIISDLVATQPREVASLSDSFIRKLTMMADYLGATVEQGWGVIVKNPKGSILILPSTDVRGIKLAVYDNEDRELIGWANYRVEMTALKAIDEILTTGVLGDNKSEEVQEDVTMLLGGINFLNNDRLEHILGIEPNSEEEPKPMYPNLEMMKRSKDFIIAEEGDEILVDFVAFYIPYYATIKDGEITYSINIIDAEDEHIKLDMDKINQLKEVCEFIIG